MKAAYISRYLYRKKLNLEFIVWDKRNVGKSYNKQTNKERNGCFLLRYEISKTINFKIERCVFQNEKVKRKRVKIVIVA